jgi:transaldolase
MTAFISDLDRLFTYWDRKAGIAMSLETPILKESILERLLKTAPGLEIWWDSSPLVYPSWARKMISSAPEGQQEILAGQLQRLYDPERPGDTLFTGVTTNPPLSYQAIQDDPVRWAAWVQDHAQQHPGQSAAQVAWELYKEIVRQGASIYLSVYERTDYSYGHLSAQVNPYTFFDAEAMLSQALELKSLSPNIAIKIPGSREGVEVIRQLTALGVSTNCTSGYTVPQFIAVAEAVQAGILEARANGVDLTGWRSVVTYMSARWEGAAEFKEQAQQLGVSLSPEDIRWAGVAIFKNAYRIFRQRAYPSKMLICSLRLGPVVEGVMRCWHVEETAGGRVVFTLPPPFLTELFTKADHLTFEARIRQDIPSAVLARLQKVPYFTSGYEPGGLALDEFNQLPALRNTWSEFKAAMDKIVAFVEEAIRAAHAQPAPA